MSEFTAFPADGLAFLKDLKVNNNREWFQENKTRYQKGIKAPATAFCEAVTFRMKAVTDDNWTAKVFRINRDIRFSKDKTPYNSHLHIFFGREGKPSGLFFGLQTERLVLASGVYTLDKGQLDAYRAVVAGPHGAALDEMVSDYTGEGLRLNDPPLKRVPRGFDKDHPRGELLKRKGLAIWIDLDDPFIMTKPEGLDVCFEAFDRLAPLRNWLDTHIPLASET